MSYVINNLKRFKRLKSNGVEYWFARDIQKLLGYSDWRNFEKAIKRAQASCDSGGRTVKNHFVELDKMVLIGSESERPVTDYALTRFACFLIAMNGDSSKPEIASAQEYFAVQTRRSELAAQIQQAIKRIEERDYLAENQKKLSCAAQSAGVKKFGKFQNAGYRAMYGGMSNSEVKSFKGINNSDKLLDCIGRAELAAHNFRATQADTRLRIENIEGENEAIKVHSEIGRIVRQSMMDAGGKLPEDLPAEVDIKRVKKDVEKYQKYVSTNSSSSVLQQHS